jgi:hypothetical protein
LIDRCINLSYDITLRAVPIRIWTILMIDSIEIVGAI